MDIRVFHDLSSKEQDELRRKYKRACRQDYKYSISLYIAYVIVGIVAVLSLVAIYFQHIILGGIVFFISFVSLVVIIKLLKKSNQKFFDFLSQNGFVYDNKEMKK